MVAYHRHPKFNALRHFVIPVFGLLANLACMAFYLIGPFMGYGTKMEPLLALGIAVVWAIYGGIYFVDVQQEIGTDNAGQEPAQATSITCPSSDRECKRAGGLRGPLGFSEMRSSRCR